MSENGEDQADDEQDDPDRGQDRQLRHQKPDNEQNDAENNHPRGLPRLSEANMATTHEKGLGEGKRSLAISDGRNGAPMRSWSETASGRRRAEGGTDPPGASRAAFRFSALDEASVKAASRAAR